MLTVTCPPLTESPFARRRRYLLQGGVSTAWAGVTPPSSLVLAHAQNRTPPIDCGLGLDRWVFAGCCEPLLAVGPSRRYLHSPCMGAWTRTPSRSPIARTRFFPGDIGLTLGFTRSAREKPLQCDFNRETRFRGCSHSLMFRLPCSLGPPIAPTAVVSHGAAGPFTPRNGPGVTPRNCGIATCLNRATDTAGLPPAGLRPCRPLQNPACITYARSWRPISSVASCAAASLG